MIITDLPLDILLLIFPYLDAKSFLAFTSTCKGYHDTNILYDSAYWSHATRSAFRVPNQRVVQNDGERWCKLYRRLLTQSKVFTWGNNARANLGHGPDPSSLQRGPRTPADLMHARRRQWDRRNCSWPTQIAAPPDLGVVADLQQGGWSTSLLNSRGHIYVVGILDNENFFTPREGAVTTATFKRLKYPAGYQYGWPQTSIKQFSSGRSHILGLADSGRIWCWRVIGFPATAIHLEDMPVPLHSPAGPKGPGAVKKVVAGWANSTALIQGVGIVVWKPSGGDNERDPESDFLSISSYATVPRTRYQRPRGTAARDPDADTRELGEQVGEVTNYVVLEHYIILVTHLGKAFAVKIFRNANAISVSHMIQLVPADEPEAFVTDVQGSFRNFALFLSSGAVLTGKADERLDAPFSFASSNAPGSLHSAVASLQLNRVPILQHSNVIQMAFGDWHAHALLSNGAILSLGNEPNACGALGLGGRGDPEARFRGMRFGAHPADGSLLTHCYQGLGRQVWFEEEKRQWIRFLCSGAVDPAEAVERMRLNSQRESVRGEVSEWLEQQGRNWETRISEKSEDDDGLGAYFALSVCAAGWHSGAIVLVNEGIARKMRETCIIPDPDYIPPPEEEAPASSTSNQSEQPVGVLDEIGGVIAGTARWLFGFGNDDGANAAGDGAQAPRGGESPTRFLRPENHGASPGKGQLYTWSKDHFPRLRLSDGTEMPGTAPFSEWKSPPPQWQDDISF